MLSNAYLTEPDFKDIQKHITKYVNMKVITKKPTHHLKSSDGGTVHHIYTLNICQQRYYGYLGLRDMRES